MTGDELIERVRARGGELRVRGSRLQYRPAGVLDAIELAWLARRRADVVRALLASKGRSDVSPRRAMGWRGEPLGEAGSDISAWHCPIDLGSGHVAGTLPDGSTVCATCHPTTLALGTAERVH